MPGLGISTCPGDLHTLDSVAYWYIYIYRGTRKRHLSLRGKVENLQQRAAGTSTATMAFPRFGDTEEAVGFVRSNFRWRWRSADRPVRSLPEDVTELCPGFDRQVAGRAADELGIPEFVQGVWYAMVLRDAMDLGVLPVDLGTHMGRTLQGLRWRIFEVWLDEYRPALLAAQRRRQRVTASPSRGNPRGSARSRSRSPRPAEGED